MPKWSTTGAAQFVKLVIVPVFGLAMLLLEQQRDVPRGLIVGAGLILIGVAPASVLEVFLARRIPPAEPPAPPAPPSPKTEQPADGSPT
jgi:hypothetical protein